MKKGYIFAFLATFLMASGQYLIKVGADKLYSIPIFTNFTLFLGIILYSGVFFLLFLAFKKEKLSKAYPILALTYLWVNLIAIFLLGENISALSWTGTALIIGGIFCITLK